MRAKGARSRRSRRRDNLGRRWVSLKGVVRARAAVRFPAATSWTSQAGRPLSAPSVTVASDSLTGCFRNTPPPVEPDLGTGEAIWERTRDQHMASFESRSVAQLTEPHRASKETCAGPHGSLSARSFSAVRSRSGPASSRSSGIGCSAGSSLMHSLNDLLTDDDQPSPA